MKEEKQYLKSFDGKDGWLLPVEFNILNFTFFNHCKSQGYYIK